jgi:hypothetical protein
MASRLPPELCAHPNRTAAKTQNTTTSPRIMIDSPDKPLLTMTHDYNVFDSNPNRFDLRQVRDVMEPKFRLGC